MKYYGLGRLIGLAIVLLAYIVMIKIPEYFEGRRYRKQVMKEQEDWDSGLRKRKDIYK